MKAVLILLAFSCALIATLVTGVSSDIQRFSFVFPLGEENINEKCEDTALHRAIRMHDSAMVSQLMKEGADAYAMSLCVKENNAYLTQILIDNNANINRLTTDGESFLHLAARYGSLSVMKVLLKNGLSADTVSLHDETPLTIAVLMDSFAMTQTLLHYKPDMRRKTQQGQTYCSIALKEKSLQSLRALAEHCVPVDEERDSLGHNAIYYAVEKDDIDTASVLAELGADLSQEYQNDKTLLHLAAGSGSTRVTRWLVQRGINVNTLMWNKWTPLHIAAYHGRLDEIKLLLQLGACINCRSTRGFTPHSFAKVNNNPSSVAKYLESKGGVD